MTVETVLGLDLGTNSIGWALVESGGSDDGESNPGRLVDAGVRIFQQGVEANKNESRNVQRRMARAMRRQHRRRNLRRNRLREALAAGGLLPADDATFGELLCRDPYALRARGLDEPLIPFELGRALYHLSQRRGFKSNRKTDRKAGKNESQVVQSAISALSEQVTLSGARTLGDFLHRVNDGGRRVRGRYTARAMYQQEFDAIWAAQQRYRPELLSDELRDRLHDIIFFQLPLRAQKGMVGDCELEPDKKRAARGTWYAQQFRMLQDVSHLEFPDLVTGEFRPLTDAERAKLVAALQPRREMTFDQIRKEIGLLDTQRFNFEEANHREKIKGNVTEWRLRQIFKSDYDRLTQPTRDQVVHDLLFVDEESVIVRHAIERWGLKEESAKKLASIELESGYLHLSQKAVQKLLPHLARGRSYMEALEDAGYQRPDQRKIEVRDELDREDLPELRNPIVMAALHQTRRVVNAIVREYGKPARIRVEMARDLKVSLGKRSEILAQNKKNHRENEATRALLETDFGLSNPTRDDLVRFRIWKEGAMVCPYTGQAIPAGAVFSSDFEIDHILPLPRSGDDSYMNKILCATSANREKGNRTPSEAWSADAKRWGEITLRINHLPYPKRRRFVMEKIPEDFIARQLNDTRYIAREARSWLETLAGRNQVQIGKGGVTAALRRRWGLNGLLSNSGEKTRADHRHHAVDAVVIALTTPAVVQRMSRLSASGRAPDEAGFAPPWEHFRDEVRRRIDSMVVSYRVLREIRGALHEETNYGILGLRDAYGNDLYALRKPLARLTRAELDRIADKRVREIVSAHLLAYGVDLATRDADKSQQWKQAMEAQAGPSMPNRRGAPVPIRKVRLHRPSSAMIALKNPAGVVYRAVESGSNHHIVIYEVTQGQGAGRWGGEVISMFEAARRARRGETIIRRDMPAGRKFVMSLGANEVVKLVEDGVAAYWRVQKLDAAAENITFRFLNAAGLEDNTTRRIKSPESLRAMNPVKVTIDPLGRERPAHD